MATQSKNAVMEHEFLPVRAKLLEVAAALDRIDRAEDALSDDGPRKRIDQAIRILLEPGEPRAARVQQLFSREYQADWRERFEV